MSPVGAFSAISREKAGAIIVVGGIQRVLGADHDGLDLHSQGSCSNLDLLQEGLRKRIRRIRQDSDTTCGRQPLSNDFETVPRDLCSRRGQSADVAARPREADDETGSDWITCGRHYDRNLVRCLLRSLGGRRLVRNDDVNFETDQLRSETGEEVQLSFRRSNFKGNVLPIDIPAVA